jgi:hypothetical protein
MVSDGRCRLRREKITAGGLEELQYGPALGSGARAPGFWMEVKQKLTPTPSVTRAAARGTIALT